MRYRLVEEMFLDGCYCGFCAFERFILLEYHSFICIWIILIKDEFL